MQEANPLKITINLNALLGELQESLQTTINLLAVALKATAPESVEDLRLPSEVFATDFSSKARWSQAEAVEKHQTWAISNGLRDAIEGASSFIESSHRVLAIWDLVSSNNGKVLYGDYQREMEGAAFHRLGLPDKLAHLKSEHGIAIDANLERHLLSINNARNCLVHRRGIVSQRDLNFDGRMIVEWRKLHLFIQNEDGEHDLVIGQIVEKESVICLRIVDERKVFAPGERVMFTAQEFADVTWGLYAFGSELVKQVSAANPDKREEAAGESEESIGGEG
jgi:hypothetical protein